MWANHAEQPAPASDILAMVEYLARNHLNKPEYLKVDGKPLLFIMEPGKVDQSANAAGMNHRQLSERIQAAARAVGLPGVLLVGGANGGVNGVTQNAKTWGYGAYFIYTYAAGINAYVSRHLRARPPEFLILGLQPEQWTPVDSLAWSIMMAWDLGGNWTSELLRLRLAQRMSVARINELLPPYPGEQPLPSADYAALARQWQVMGTLAERVISAAPESGP